MIYHHAYGAEIKLMSEFPYHLITLIFKITKAYKNVCIKYVCKHK